LPPRRPRVPLRKSGACIENGEEHPQRAARDIRKGIGQWRISEETSSRPDTNRVQRSPSAVAFHRSTAEEAAPHVHDGRLVPADLPNPHRHAVQEFITTRQGYRLATSTGGVLTGRGADLTLIDDPSKREEALSDARRNATPTGHSRGSARSECGLQSRASSPCRKATRRAGVSASLSA